MLKILFTLPLVFSILTITGCVVDHLPEDPTIDRPPEKPEDLTIDPPPKGSEDFDFNFPGQDFSRLSVLSHGLARGNFVNRILASPNPMMRAKTQGFSVGGAKDINNFRENIKNKFFPLSTDITYEGIFYDYFFDTGLQEPCKKLLCASYTSAVSKDPFSKKKEYFLSVGLNSGADEQALARKKLNLVIVIDVSGSMDSYFDRYYYDQNQDTNSSTEDEEDKELFEKEFNKTKMRSASESVSALLNHLKSDDSLGIVLFNEQAHTALSLKKVRDINLENLKSHILEIQADGGTNMSAGIEQATSIFHKHINNETPSNKIENRMIVLTDAQINTGETDGQSLLNTVKANAKQKIYTSFIGIGVDFNTELIETINKTSGANHYSVHSPVDFKKRMDDEFDLMVTPLVFDLKMQIKSSGFKIKTVYGSPSADKATGEVMKVATLFPSQSKEEEIRGGIVILHLEEKPNKTDNKIQIELSYKNRMDQEDTHSLDFEFKNEPEFYDNTGIRKGILLIRYVRLIKNWILDKNHAENPNRKAKLNPQDIYKKHNSLLSFTEEEIDEALTYWERESQPLAVSDEYKKLFLDFTGHFKKEIKEVKDNSLKKELKILNFLANYTDSSVFEAGATSTSD